MRVLIALLLFTVGVKKSWNVFKSGLFGWGTILLLLCLGAGCGLLS